MSLVSTALPPPSHLSHPQVTPERKRGSVIKRTIPSIPEENGRQNHARKRTENHQIKFPKRRFKVARLREKGLPKEQLLMDSV